MKYISFLLGLFFAFRCISPADINAVKPDAILAVNGFITDQPGPHGIRIDRLSRFTGVRGEEGTTRFEQNVRVRILDDLGRVTPVERVTITDKIVYDADPPGCVEASEFITVLSTNYRTPKDFIGEVGRTYTIEIEENDGKMYRSTPQTMLPTPPINSIDFRFTEIPTTGTLRSGVEVYAEFQDPAGENYYFWQVNGIYRIFTPQSNQPEGCCLFDPVDQRADKCWILERNVSGNTLALSDRLFDGQTTRQLAGIVEDDGIRFANPTTGSEQQYHVELLQHNMSLEAFAYNERIGNLREINGELFDPLPISVGGNLYNVENPNDPIIGFFGAYSVQTKSMFINRDILSFVQPFPGPCGDCRVRPGAQVEVPEPYRR